MPALEDYLHPFKNIYRVAPPWVKQTAGRFYALLPRRFRYGPELARARRFLRESERWSRERLEDFQWRQLQELLEHAYANVPYYRRTWKELGIHPRDIREPLDFQRLPLLTKDKVRGNKEEFVAETHRKSLVAANTGGSTGEPLELYWERGRTRALERAFMWRQWSWAGFEYGERTAILRGQTVKGAISHYDPIDRHLFLSGFQLSDATAPEYLSAIRRFRPISLQAYPSAATVLAQYMRRTGEPPIEGLKVVLAGSENVYPEQRRIVEQAFGARLYSWYGHAESGALAGGCEINNAYHVYSEYGYTELLADGRAVPLGRGERGEIVTTGFINRAMPLIRYRTGDIAITQPGVCDCGRNYPLWERVEGRKHEYVVGAESQIVSLTAFIFGQHYEAFDRISRIQVVQREPQVLTIRLVVTPEWSVEDGNQLKGEMLNALGGNWKLKIELTDQMELTPSGKHKFVVQHLPLPDVWSGNQQYD